MTLNKNTRILIVGLGVIGGGYASALTDAGFTVDCITKNPEDIAYAKQHDMIRYGTCEVEPTLVAEAQLIIFALYPTVFIDWIEQYQHLLSPGTLITDVTGVKGTVVERVQGMLREDVELISAHPMAGRESSGVAYSDAKVFRGANYIVTPTDKNTPEAIELCKELGRVLGFGRISTLSIREHDEMIAFLSQLTHCIAVSLMTCNDTPDLERYTGDSFRDLTRIARINDRMWSELFLMNKEALLRQMDQFIQTFTSLRDMIEQGQQEPMRAMMRASTERRARFDKPTAR